MFFCLEQPFKMTAVTFLPLKCPIKAPFMPSGAQWKFWNRVCVCGIEMSLYTVKQQLKVNFLWSVLLTLALVTDLGAATHKVCLLFISRAGRNWAGSAAAAVRFSSPPQSLPQAPVKFGEVLSGQQCWRTSSKTSSSAGVLTGNSTSIIKLGACLNQQILFPFNYSLDRVWQSYQIHSALINNESVTSSTDTLKNTGICLWCSAGSRSPSQVTVVQESPEVFCARWDLKHIQIHASVPCVLGVSPSSGLIEGIIHQLIWAEKQKVNSLQ